MTTGILTQQRKFGNIPFFVKRQKKILKKQINAVYRTI